jgi:hypothetical protein
MPMLFFRFFRPATAAICAVILVLWGSAGLRPVQAATTGPFSNFGGNWSGSGTIRQQGGKTERIRCRATYRERGSTGHQVDLRLSCDSDSYKFDLSGNFSVDASNQLSGRWTEQSRSIGGTVLGLANGNRLQIHIESSAFSANLHMTTRSRRQTVRIDSHGGGQVVTASISLHKR